eukprot:gene24710-29860_t
MASLSRKLDDDQSVAAASIILSDSEDEEVVGEKRKAPTAEDKPVEEEVQLKVTKKAKNVKPFDEALLVGPHGLSRIYHEFPLRIRYQKNQEVPFLRQLMSLYKEWAFQLHPGLSFEDAMLKIGTLSHKARVRGAVSELRDLERTRYTNEVLMPKYRAAREKEAASAAEKPLPSTPPPQPALPLSDTEAEETQSPASSKPFPPLQMDKPDGPASGPPGQESEAAEAREEEETGLEGVGDVQGERMQEEEEEEEQKQEEGELDE